MIFAAALAVVSAAILGVLPALKATGANAQAQMRNLGSGGATLRFGKVWTAVMIGQVALTVICLPFALEFAWNTKRDLDIRSRFPALHRWNGRLFLLTVTGLSLSGFYLVWVRGSSPGAASAVSTNTDANMALLRWS